VLPDWRIDSPSMELFYQFMINVERGLEIIQQLVEIRDFSLKTALYCQKIGL
jgi:hypothetical protein